MNNVHFVKKAEGQATEAFDELNRNKTYIKFATGGQIDSPTIAGSLAGNDNSPRRITEVNRSISLGSDEGLSPRRIKNGKKFKQRSTSEKPSASRLQQIHMTASGKQLLVSPSGK